MSNPQRSKAIKDLNKFIWEQQNKCDGISKVNKELILDYCRFTVMAAEMSKDLQMKLDDMDEETFDLTIKKYEKFNKIALNLYKVLKFEQIKDELADYGNPYTKLFVEAEKDGDI